MVPQSVIRFWAAVLAVVALVGYVVLVVLALIWSIKSGDDPDFLTGEGTTYVTTGLAGLVGGVVAGAFGQTPPSAKPDPTQDRRKRNLQSLAKVLTPGQQRIRAVIASAYLSFYLVLGVIAIVVWIWKGNDVLDSIKGLASTTAGLTIAVVGAYLRERD